MTVRELRAILDGADDDATVLVAGDEGGGRAIEYAAVWSQDDIDYTGLPGSPGDVVITPSDVEEIER